MSKELDRLNLHRQIITGKIAIPSNEATQRVLRDHLARVDRQIDAILHPVTKEQREQERFDEQEAAIRRRIHFNRRNHRPGKRELRGRLREIRLCQDDPYYAQLAKKERAEEKVMHARIRQAVAEGRQQELIDEATARVRAVLAKYARVAA
jgi:hypothetical protein